MMSQKSANRAVQSCSIEHHMSSERRLDALRSERHRSRHQFYKKTTLFVETSNQLTLYRTSKMEVD